MNIKILLLGLLPVMVAATASPTVEIGPGKVIGTTTTLPSSTVTVNKFLGIPYAVNPPKRFLLPEKLEHFDGPVNATAFSKECFQAHNGQLPMYPWT
jgi:carboxylesterase type B